MACQSADQWPFQKTCQKLGKEEFICENDLECELNYYCWFPSPAKAVEGKKQCMPIYALDDGETFGYKAQDRKFKYNMLENYEYGKACKSGIAVIDAALNQMTCVQIKQVVTNLATPAAP